MERRKDMFAEWAENQREKRTNKSTWPLQRQHKFISITHPLFFLVNFDYPINLLVKYMSNAFVMADIFTLNKHWTRQTN